jgi:poly(3-hydroxybutyrate) depolymerase
MMGAMEAPLQPGPNRYAFADPRPGPKREIAVHVYRPAFFGPHSPIVVVMAGRKRNAAAYLDYWQADAERRGFLVVAPEFDKAQYPDPSDYSYGAMCGADGAIRPREEWLFPVIEAIFRDARSRAGSMRERYFLFGHSAGAQLVHRLVTFAWPESIERAIAANAGSYAMPVRTEDVPFGLGGLPYPDADVRALLSRPMILHLGDQDIDPSHEDLPREPAAMRQGPQRFARGLRYMETASTEAGRLGVPLAWRLVIAPGVAHSGQGMTPLAARELFDSSAHSTLLR